MARWRIAGINFDHFHMGDNLRMAAEHEDAQVVGVCDLVPERTHQAAAELGLTEDQIFSDYCLGYRRNPRSFDINVRLYTTTVVNRTTVPGFEFIIILLLNPNGFSRIVTIPVIQRLDTSAGWCVIS